MYLLEFFNFGLYIQIKLNMKPPSIYINERCLISGLNLQLVNAIMDYQTYLALFSSIPIFGIIPCAIYVLLSVLCFIFGFLLIPIFLPIGCICNNFYSNRIVCAPFQIMGIGSFSFFYGLVNFSSLCFAGWYLEIYAPAYQPKQLQENHL